jgi:hypothetical protein
VTNSKFNNADLLPIQSLLEGLLNWAALSATSLQCHCASCMESHVAAWGHTDHAAWGHTLLHGVTPVIMLHRVTPLVHTTPMNSSSQSSSLMTECHQLCHSIHRAPCSVAPLFAAKATPVPHLCYFHMACCHVEAFGMMWQSSCHLLALPWKNRGQDYYATTLVTVSVVTGHYD